MAEKRPLSILLYLEESKRPGVALAFIFPILAAYEGGVRFMNLGRDEHTVNAADAILKHAFETIGIYGALLSALCIVVTLIFMHLYRDLPWDIRPATVGIMILESFVIALPLIPLQKIIGWALLTIEPAQELGTLEKLVLSLGAGVYEEFLFRMVLLGLLLLLARSLLGKKRETVSYVIAATISAVIFAAFHHFGQYGDPFTLEKFAFRTVAGVYFAWIYLTRGFGIAVGCHTAYDLIVVGSAGFL
ncbi:MAG: CPBP family intramembrane metalloprotease [Planctomycetes bacterium]|nr:CPBP family intramembrane metalloprotease [Planctomycetota bacterium]